MRAGRVSPSSSKVPRSADQGSLKLRTRADTQICRTGAFGLTTNRVSGGLLEEDVEDAALEFNFKALAVGQVHQPALERFEGLVGLCGELLVGERV